MLSSKKFLTMRLELLVLQKIIEIRQLLVIIISTFLEKFDLSQLNIFLIDGQLTIMEGCMINCMVKGCMVKDFYGVAIIFILLQTRLQEFVACILQCNIETKIIWGGVTPYKIICIKLFKFNYYSIVIFVAFAAS